VPPIRLPDNVSPIIRKHGFVKIDVYSMTLCRSGQFKCGSKKARATTSQALRSIDRPRLQVTSASREDLSDVQIAAFFWRFFTLAAAAGGRRPPRLAALVDIRAGSGLAIFIR
jgi:hypothetical protein